jgi:hypothetical protein
MNINTKINININSISSARTLFLGALFLFIFFFNYENYVGNKFLFFLFNFLSYVLFLTAIRKNASSFEFFLFILLILGFWFKFSCILYFDRFNFTEGDFDLNNSNYDAAIILSITAFMACIFASFAREFIFKKFFIKKVFIVKSKFFLFYTKYRHIILSFFVFFIIIVLSLNFFFKIYSKGLINNNIPILIDRFFAWCLTYGISVLTSLLIYIDFFITKTKSYFILGFFETFFVNISIYSRAFILYFFAYLRGFFKLTKFDNSILIKIIFLLFIFFLVSFHYVSHLRNKFFIIKDEYNPITIVDTFSGLSSLMVNRWVGIDSALAVSQKKDRNFDFFLSSLKEEKEHQKQSFYIKHFLKGFVFDKNANKNLNTVILPGIVAFLYYSGSLIFVFLSIVAIVFLCSLIEILFFRLSFNNVILSSIIGFILAMRVAHFGYLPLNTVYFLFSLVVTLLFVYFFSKFIWKK